ncbi:MAG: PKD domain-containing protein [Methanosarcina sp.]
MIENSDQIKTDCDHSIKTLNNAQGASTASMFVASGFLLAIMQKLVSSIAVNIIMKQIFPSNNINFDQMRDEMSKTVTGIIAEQTVQEQEGIINGLIDFFKYDYSTRKEYGNATKTDLYNMLSDNIPRLRQVLNTLKSPLFQKKGFPAYISGLELLICFYTEMASQDPTVPDSTRSSNVKALAMTIIDSSESIKTLKSRYIEERITGLSGFNCGPWMPLPGVFIFACSFDDDYFTPPKRYIFTGDTPDIASKKAKEYRDYLVNKTYKELSWIDEVLAGWNQMFTTPLFSSFIWGIYGYITNRSDNTVSVIDTKNDTVIATVNVGSEPTGVAINSTGTKVYVVNTGSYNVSVIGTLFNTVEATVNVDSVPIGIAVTPDGSTVYVVNACSNNVSVIDTKTNTVTDEVYGIGSGPHGVAVNPMGTKVYVTIINSNTVAVIDTATNTVTTKIAKVGNFPHEIAVSPDGTKVYVTNWGGNNVSVIDTVKNVVIATVPVGHYPGGVAVNPAGTRVYVTDCGEGWLPKNVSVIDTATNTVTNTVEVGNLSNSNSSWFVSVTPDGTKVYVTTGDDNTVAVIDTATNTVTNTVKVGRLPFAMGQFIYTPPVKRLSSCTDISGVDISGADFIYAIVLQKSIAFSEIADKTTIPYDAPSTFTPQLLQFLNTSINSTEWNWDFGDGVTSTEENPMHIYSTAGKYTVMLTITNDKGILSSKSSILDINSIEFSSNDTEVIEDNISIEKKTI